MRLSDYVIEFLETKNVGHVFMVSGGGAMFLIDSLGKSKTIKYVCNHHEQASVMSAEGYQRVEGELGVALVTTGPAATNALTGLLCAWNDSIPLLVISGQANSKSLIGETGLRQRGVHEVNIVKMVEGVTKYAVTVMDANKIGYYLEKAYHLAMNGRPGPVWIDIPLDIQSAQIEPGSLEKYVPEPAGTQGRHIGKIWEPLHADLAASRRPVILAGYGIKLAKQVESFYAFIDRYQVPVVTTKNAMDIMPDDHPLLAGRVGTYGQRAGNFAMQNSDLLICLGTRLSQPTTGYERDLFAREAKKYIIDIDSNVLAHHPFADAEKIELDLVEFFKEVASSAHKTDRAQGEAWIDQCRHWRKVFPVVSSEVKRQKQYVDSYCFFETLSEVMQEGDILVTDQGATFYSFTTAFKVKKRQHVFTNGGFSPMGYGLPAAVGACFARDKNTRVVCAHGDGGLEMNMQELQTMVHYNLPIKLFVFNNQGYLSIKHTQNAYFSGHLVGSDPSSGVSCPDFKKIGKAYGIPAYGISSHRDLKNKLQTYLDIPGPVIIELLLDPLQPFYPRVTSKEVNGKMVSMPLEDMYPFLPREQFNQEMIIKPL